MPSKAVLGVVVTSFLIVVLIFSLYSIPDVFARKITKGPIECYGNPNSGASSSLVTCCQNTIDSSGLEIKYCTNCELPGPTNCGPRYEAHGGGVNPTVGPTPAGNALPPPGNNTGTPGKTSIFNPVRNVTNAFPPSNNSGTPPLGGIIKVPVNHTNALPPGNNTGNPIAMMSLSLIHI